MKKKSLQPFSKELFTFPSEGIRYSNLNFNVKMTGQWKLANHMKIKNSFLNRILVFFVKISF